AHLHARSSSPLEVRAEPAPASRASAFRADLLKSLQSCSDRTPADRRAITRHQRCKTFGSRREMSDCTWDNASCLGGSPIDQIQVTQTVGLRTAQRHSTCNAVRLFGLRKLLR